MPQPICFAALTLVPNQAHAPAARIEAGRSHGGIEVIYFDAEHVPVIVICRPIALVNSVGTVKAHASSKRDGDSLLVGEPGGANRDCGVAECQRMLPYRQFFYDGRR